MHIAYSVMKDCINHASYGEICVHCNACGRIDKATEKECKLRLYKEMLQAQHDFNNWIEGMEELQKSNIQANIEYFKAKIAELEG
jgi:hypothetical protein